jgi:tetratricopeptide (TPR) repeat protein
MMVIKYEPLNRRERIMRLFREAIEAENARDLETAKRKLDEIMELAREEEPEFYFEACFRLAEIFLQEDNYRGAVKCALRGIHRAPNEDLYRLGVKRLGDVLFIMKEKRRLNDIAEGMDVTLGLVKDDEELYSFVQALVRIARGEEVEERFSLEEFNEILGLLKG